LLEVLWGENPSRGFGEAFGGLALAELDQADGFQIMER
jgi:hypothetical protein